MAACLRAACGFSVAVKTMAGEHTHGRAWAATVTAAAAVNQGLPEVVMVDHGGDARLQACMSVQKQACSAAALSSNRRQEGK